MFNQTSKLAVNKEKAMKCTACKKGNLINSYIEGSIPCHTCDHCGGHLLMLEHYLSWKDMNDQNTVVNETSIEISVEDTTKAMLCPITGQLMIKYRISKDTDHHLDLSPSSHAIWLDKGEWELLKTAGLSYKLNNIFSDHWQNNIRFESSADFLSTMYQKKFGQNYALIKKFREHLSVMNNKSEVMAYLLSDDPYKF